MKNIKLDIDYKLTGVDKDSDPAEITVGYIQVACNIQNPKGLEGKERRMWSRIQRKLDDALDLKKEVELEDSEFDFIKELFNKDLRMPAGTSKYVVILEDYLDEIYKQSEEK